MSELKHTPGPWYAVNYADFWDIQDDPHYGELDLLDAHTCNQAEANAKLMAAAPNLLNALSHLCEVMKPHVMKLNVRKGFSEHVALAGAQKAIKEATE